MCFRALVPCLVRRDWCAASAAPALRLDASPVCRARPAGRFAVAKHAASAPGHLPNLAPAPPARYAGDTGDWSQQRDVGSSDDTPLSCRLARASLPCSSSFSRTARVAVIATAQATAWRPRLPRCPLSFRAVSSALSLLLRSGPTCKLYSLTVHRQAPAGAGVFVPSRLLCRSWLTTGFCRPSAPWRLPRAAASPSSLLG